MSSVELEISTQHPGSYGSWTVRGAGVLLRVSSPEVHYRIASSTTSSQLTLPIADAARNDELVEIPNQRKAAATVLSGRAVEPAFALRWRLVLVVNAGATAAPPSVYARVELELEAGGAAAVVLEHVVVGRIEVDRDARADDAPAALARSASAPRMLPPSRAATAPPPSSEPPLPPPPVALSRSASLSAVSALVASPARLTSMLEWLPLVGRYVRAWRAAPARESAFLLNGWQSFSFAGVLHGAQPQPTTPFPTFSGAFHAGARPPPADAAADARLLASDWVGVLRLGGGGGALAGFLSQRAAFGGVAAAGDGPPDRLLLFAEVGAEVRAGAPPWATDWAVVMPLPRTAVAAADGAAALRAFAAAVAALAGAAPPKPAPVGWCSWYCHGPSVSSALMLEATEKLRLMAARGELPADKGRPLLVQLDDGWQAAWGDWLTPNAKFPDGLRPFAAAARAAGFVPGLWLAPAALTKDSALAAAHPEWILRDARGRPVDCGYTAPGLWMLALDVSHPEALAHVRRVVRTLVHEWGFGYLKCDFLHCAAMPSDGRHDGALSRAAALERLVAAIRDEAGPDTFVLGCGAPLGPCAGHVDAIRVSADAATHWLPVGPNIVGTRWLFSSDRTNLPAARNQVRNTLARLALGGAFWLNDADCLILREEGAEFTLGQARALASVAALGGSPLIFSDGVGSLAADRLAVLQALLPPLPAAATPLDLFSAANADGIPSTLALALDAGTAGSDGWLLVGLFNWSDDTADVGVRLRDAYGALGAAPPGGFGGDAELCDAAAGDLGWHAFDFWSGRYRRLDGADPTLTFPVRPRRCVVCAVRRVAARGAPQYVGSSVHLSCGLELRKWTEGRGARGRRALTLALGVGRAVDAPSVWLHLPGSRQGDDAAPRLAGEEPGAGVEHVGDDVWRLRMDELRPGAEESCTVEWGGV